MPTAYKGRMNRVEDPKGNRLIPIVLEVITRDDKERPLTLRCRRDNEVIGLAESGSAPTFLIVWATVNSTVGESGFSAIMKQAEEARDLAIATQANIEDLERDVRRVTADNAKLTDENEKKTAELRMLQRERDPERLERAVTERVVLATKDLAARSSVLKAELQSVKQELESVRTAKKRLRDSLDRLQKKG